MKYIKIIKRVSMKELLFENAKIIEKSKSRVLVEYDEKGKRKQKVYKYSGPKGVGDTVSLFTTSNVSIFHMLFLFIPVFCLILGICVGFVFENKVFQYILTLSLGLVSFLFVAIIEKRIFKKSLNKIICE